MRAFWLDEEEYDKNPIETINTTLFTIWIKEVEKDLFLCLLLSHENLYTDNWGEHSDISMSSFAPTYGVFKEEDSQILNETLKLYYDLFCLFHNNFKDLYDRSPQYLVKVLDDFTNKFDEYFFKTSWGKTYFNNAVYRGFPVWPMDSKIYLYAQKLAHSLDVEKLTIFYKEYFVYGNIPLKEAEKLHNYLIGPFSERRDGYVESWKDLSSQGKAIKCLRKKI